MKKEKDQLPYLSKTKYIEGLQCPKLLWYEYNRKEDMPEFDAAAQAIMDQGTKVGELAQTLFPGGIALKRDSIPERQAEQSLAAMKLRKPLYEAGFVYKHAYALADILNPVGKDAWDLYEVKSSTGIKDIYYADAAFQKYCYEGAGIKIRKVYLVYINNQYVKNGPIDPAALFIQEEITEEVEGLVGNVENQINRMIDIVKQKECPDIKIGLHCSDPYECVLQDVCWDFLPEENVFILNRIHKKKAFELIESGIQHIKDIPGDYSLSASQKVQCGCHANGQAKVDLAAIKGFLDELEFPIYFLDFETIGPAVPVYDQSRPYQQVPFQFSLHILPAWDKEAAHHSFLAQNQDDPRPELLSKLESLIKDKGSILSYNMSFELTRLRESVAVYPKYEPWFKGIEKRFMDLIVPFRKFDYYDPKQMGRTSIKNVFPALTGGTYEGLEIGDGGTASLEYGRVMFSDGISPQDKERVLRGLEEYCKLDTQAMIDILKVLKNVCK